jgi:hypothetical protein
MHDVEIVGLQKSRHGAGCCHGGAPRVTTAFGGFNYFQIAQIKVLQWDIQM